jgi:hypothetical protein
MELFFGGMGEGVKERGGILFNIYGWGGEPLEGGGREPLRPSSTKRRVTQAMLLS